MNQAHPENFCGECRIVREHSQNQCDPCILPRDHAGKHESDAGIFWENKKPSEQNYCVVQTIEPTEPMLRVYRPFTKINALKFCANNNRHAEFQMLELLPVTWKVVL